MEEEEIVEGKEWRGKAGQKKVVGPAAVDDVAEGDVGVRWERGTEVKPRRRVSCLASLRIRPRLKLSAATSGSNL